MQKMKALVFKIAEVPTPKYATDGSVGFDLTAAEQASIGPGEVELVHTGLVIKPPKGYFLMLTARSSLAIKKGLILANGVGIVDPDYCGVDDEIKVALMNVGDGSQVVLPGDRIAQGLFFPAVQADFEEFDPEQASRGGFGSTGGYQTTVSLAGTARLRK